MARKVGILTGGGDCPGLNAVIRAVSKSLILQNNIKVIGFEDGFDGLILRKTVDLTYDAVSGILQTGGTILGTSNKANPFRHAIEKNGKLEYVDKSKEVLAYIEELQLEALVCIGGDGTMAISKQMIEMGVPIVGVPKTIDNDIFHTDMTFGYDTAVTIAAEAIDRIHTTAQSHHRIMLVEVMGRYAGWLTLAAGIAGGADIILLPEIDYNLDVVCDRCLERSRKGRRFSIIAVSEGAKPINGNRVVSRVIKDSPDQIRLGGIAIKLGNDIEDQTGLETRATVLGHLQRGGSPTPFDRILATRYGVAAAELVGKRQYNEMVALRGNEIVSVPIRDVGGKTRTVPLDSPLIHTAEAVGTSMGI
ncbi:MAG TPA: ATP-dependent 6-phosphofructokinase [bacterium]|nr:ATP-dependent 6-phosphofructokinase [bacterium]